MDYYRDNTPMERALGLQPGELYDAAEECHTRVTEHAWHGRTFVVYYDELASPLSQWKAFATGIGTKSAMERDTVIETMRHAISDTRLVNG